MGLFFGARPPVLDPPPNIRSDRGGATVHGYVDFGELYQCRMVVVLVAYCVLVFCCAYAATPFGHLQF